MGKAVNVLRWVAILPGAVLGAWLAYNVFQLIWGMILFFYPSLLTGLIEPGIGDYSAYLVRGLYEMADTLFSSAAFVYSASRIAPEGSDWVAFASAATLLAYGSIALVVAVGSPSDWWDAIGAAGVCLGAGVVGWMAYRSSSHKSC